MALVAPRIRKDLDISQARQRESLATVKRALDALEAGWLMNTRYIAGDNVTIADLAAYVEIGQLQPRFTNLFDFAPYPNIRRWLTDMQQVDGHDETHIVLTELGDISREAPSMDTIKNANKSALRALKQLQT